MFRLVFICFDWNFNSADFFKRRWLNKLTFLEFSFKSFFYLYYLCYFCFRRRFHCVNQLYWSLQLFFILFEAEYFEIALFNWGILENFPIKLLQKAFFRKRGLKIEHIDLWFGLVFFRFIEGDISEALHKLDDFGLSLRSEFWWKFQILQIVLFFSFLGCLYLSWMQLSLNRQFFICVRTGMMIPSD